jgi:hypothetical protein
LGVTKQTNVDAAIERRLLELAHTTDAKITVPALAYFAPCSMADAARVLDDLAAHDRLTMDVTDDGTIVYEMPGRQQLAGLGPAAPRAHGLVPALVPAVATRPRLGGLGRSPLIAAMLAGFIPGAGHAYAGRIAAAVGWFFAVSLGYALIIPGLILHVLCMASAAASVRRLPAVGPAALLAA